MSDLPFLDEHARVVAAEPDAVWRGLLRVATGAFDRSVGPLAKPWGLQPARPGGPRPLAVGSAGPGFTVAELVPGERLVLAGRHRFSRYRLEFLLDPPLPGGGVRVRARSLAAFDGPHGAVYRALVIGTRGHVLAVRHLLRAVERASR